MSTKSHDAKKAMEHNLLLSEQKSLKKEARECEQSNSQMSSPVGKSNNKNKETVLDPSLLPTLKGRKVVM